MCSSDEHFLLSLFWLGKQLICACTHTQPKDSSNLENYSNSENFIKLLHPHESCQYAVLHCTGFVRWATSASATVSNCASFWILMLTYIYWTMYHMVDSVMAFTFFVGHWVAQKEPMSSTHAACMWVTVQHEIFRPTEISHQDSRMKFGTLESYQPYGICNINLLKGMTHALNSHFSR